MRRILSSIVFTAALLCPWIAYAQAPPTSCTTTSQNLWVRDQLNTYYYWYQFLPAGVNPATYNSPEAYLEAVRYRPIDNTFSFITRGRIERRVLQRQSVHRLRVRQPDDQHGDPRAAGL